MSRTAPKAALAAALAVAAVALAACGGGHKTSSTSATGRGGAGGTPGSTTGGSTTHGGTSGGGGGTTDAESPPPGSGGTEPVRAPATLIGNSGRITPTRVQIPPYIAVTVTLTSTDGRTYGVKVNGKTLSVNASTRNASLTLPGLRPGKKYTAKPVGGGAAITITPSAEPGP